MNDLMNIVNNTLLNNIPVVLITITSKDDGSPGTPGQMMAVTKDGYLVGTVGGGMFEYTMIERAQQALNNNEIVYEFDIDLSSIGMICGGRIKGYARVLGNERPIIIFGAGHVALALSKIIATLNMPLIVIDDRSELAANYTNITYLDNLINDVDDKYFSNKPYVIISTRGASYDYQSLKKALNYDCSYIGMIGSTKKVKQIFNDLEQEGVSKEKLQEVYAPIGLDIASSLPSEIAIAILAEILQVKNKGQLINKRELRM